jgi:hypothetical protein
LVNKIRQYWFGGLLAIFMLLFLGMVIIIAIAPHNDEKMRGFTPCTYEMADNISIYSGQRQLLGVVGAIVNSYVCYFNVMEDGLNKWYNNEQDTPWDNYIFEPETMEVAKELSEPFSNELLKANKLNDESGDIFDFRENENE